MILNAMKPRMWLYRVLTHSTIHLSLASAICDLNRADHSDFAYLISAISTDVQYALNAQIDKTAKMEIYQVLHLLNS